MALGERLDGGQKKDGERGHKPRNMCDFWKLEKAEDIFSLELSREAHPC